MDSIEEFRKRYVFDINTPIGRGGFGEVYRGIDLSNGSEVAIKKSEATPGMKRYSLLEEFETGKSFKHPNLLRYHCAYRFTTTVGAFDFGVMEYVNGGDLDDFMRTFPSQEQINNLLLGVLHGLNYLHGLQIVHRDLKPSNILIHYERGVAIPKIIDFGISKQLSSDASVISNIIGSYEYMSPEQLGASGNKISPNSDLWTLGVVMYQLFTGELPFGSRAQGHTSGEIIGKILSASTPEEIEVIPQPYQTMIQACLVKEPTKRISTTSQLLDILHSKPQIAKLSGAGAQLVEQKQSVRPAVENEIAPKVQADKDFPKVKLGRRFLAYLLDNIFATLLMLPGLLIGFLGLAATEDDNWIAIAIILGGAPSIVYILFRDSLNAGQSWGKKIIGLRVLIRPDFRECDSGRSFFKNLVFSLGGFFPFILLIEIIVLLANEKFRGLSELISSTQVVEEKDYQMFKKDDA